MSVARPLSRRSGAGRDPATAILIGAGIPTVAVIAIVTAGALVVGRDQAASVAVGGGMALVALASAPLLQRVTARADPIMVLGVAVLAYCTLIIGIWIAFLQVDALPWLDGDFAGWSVAAVIVVWTTGQMRSARRARRLLYDTEELPTREFRGARSQPPQPR